MTQLSTNNTSCECCDCDIFCPVDGPFLPSVMEDETSQISPQEALSAAGWTLGLNIFIFALGFSLYGWLKRKPGYLRQLYLPRVVLEEENEYEASVSSSLSLRSLLADTSNPFSSLWKLMLLTEDQMLPHVGLDGIVFLRILEMGYQLSSLLTIFVAFPLSLVYGFAQFEDSRTKAVTGSPSESSVVFDIEVSIVNLPTSGAWTWSPVVFLFIATGIVIFVLEKHNADMLQMRVRALLALGKVSPSAHQHSLGERPCEGNPSDGSHSLAPHLCTLLVRDIPPFIPVDGSVVGVGHVSGANMGWWDWTLRLGGRDRRERGEEELSDAGVCRMMSALYPGSMVRAHLVPNPEGVWQAVQARDLLRERLLHLRTRAEQENSGEINLLKVEKLQQRIKDTEEMCRVAEEKVRSLRSQAESLPSSTAFVSLSSTSAAAIAPQVMQTMNTSVWLTTAAPTPKDINWNALHTPRWMRTVLAWVWPVGVVAVWLLFFVPVTFIAGLSTLSNLEATLPWLEALIDIPVVTAFLEGFLPGLGLTIVLSLVPFVFLFNAKLLHHPSVVDQHREVVRDMFWLLVIDVLLGASFVKTILQNWKTLVQQPDVVDFLQALGFAVPATAYVFVSYICAKLGVGLTMEVLRVARLIPYTWGLLTFSTQQQERRNWLPVPFADVVIFNVPWVQFILLLVFLYSVVTPVVSLFGVAFFWFSRLLWRNQLLFVYSSERDTLGSAWGTFASHLVLSLILAQVAVAASLMANSLHSHYSWVLLLALVTVLYMREREDRTRQAFTRVPLQISTQLDSLHPTTQEEVQEHLEQYIPPYMKDDQDPNASDLVINPIFEPSHGTQYGSISQAARPITA